MRKILFAVVLGLLGVSSFSQNVQALPFAAYCMDASASAMGGTRVAGGDVAWAALSNPASVTLDGKKFSAGASAMIWQPKYSGETFGMVGLSWKISDRVGICAAGLYGGWKKYDVYGDGGTVSGTYRPFDLNMALGLSVKIVKWLSLGVNAHYLQESLAPGHAYRAFAADAIVEASFKGLSISAGVLSAGTKVKAADDTRYSLPSSAVIGASYSCKFAGTHEIKPALEFDYYFANAVSLGAGLAYSWNDIVSVRGGYHYGGKNAPVPSYGAAGIGLSYWGVALNLSCIFGPKPLGGSTIIGLSYSF